MTKILIANDECAVNQHLKSLLTTFGYTASCVTRPEEVLPTLERESFSLILLDINMPGANGLPLLKQLKAHPLYQTIPVLMLAEGAEGQAPLDCLEAGAADIIAKPVQGLILKARVGAALAGQAVQDRRQQPAASTAPADSRAEQPLAEEYELVITILDTVDALVVVLDRQGRIVRFNRACEQITGYALAEAHNKYVWDLFLVPEEIEPVKAVFSKLQAGYFPNQYENYWVTKSGKRRLIAWSNNVILDSDGAVKYVIGAGIDITEQRQVEESLSKSEFRNRAILNAIPDLIFVIDKNGLIVDFKGAAENKLLVAPADFLGKSVYEVLPAEMAQQRMNLVERALKSDQIQIDEYQLFLHGQTHYEETRAIAAGESEVLAIVRDITERVQTEQELQKHRQQLETLVEARTAELRATNTQLQQEIVERKRVEAQLKISLQEKDVLLKEIHHRVKNNLQIVSSLLDLQADYIEDKQARQVFKESQQRVKSMALVHERLYQSRNLAQIDIAEYIESLTGYLLRSYGATANKVSLQLDITPLTLSIETAIPCGLIINELVSNVLKYAFPADQDQVGQIGIALQRAEDHQLILQVWDNGVGFPPEIDFRRTTSLGLTLVITLVKQLNGIIELNSQPGTEFTITFTDKVDLTSG